MYFGTTTEKSSIMKELAESRYRQIRVRIYHAAFAKTKLSVAPKDALNFLQYILQVPALNIDNIMT